MATKQMTIYVEEDLKNALDRRAKQNRRTTAQEVCFLIEAALASEFDVDLEFIRKYFLSRGGASGVIESQEAKSLEQTGKA